MSNLPNNLREYARVLEMCEGANVNPLDCFRQRISVGTTAQATMMDQVMGLLAEPYPIEFALAIVEGRPVFKGDHLFFEGESRRIDGLHPRDSRFFVYDLVNRKDFPRAVIKEFSWNPPKRTFLLNGVELPLPVPAEQIPFDSLSSGFRLTFQWDSEKDRDLVQQALVDMMGCKEK